MPADLTFERFDEAYANRMLGRKGRQGIDAYLGIVVTAFTPGRLVAEFEIRDELVTPLGNIHGGCLSVLVDHCLGVIMYPVMPPGYWAATTEFKINLLSACLRWNMHRDGPDPQHEPPAGRRHDRGRERRSIGRPRPGHLRDRRTLPVARVTQAQRRRRCEGSGTLRSTSRRWRNSLSSISPRA